jgi:hypothetical protein
LTYQGIPGQQRPPSKFYFLGKEAKRQPLLGYYDISSNAQWYKDRALMAGETNEDFNPTQHERQAQALIDLPRLLTRDLGVRTDYNAEDPAYRFRDPYADTYKNRLLNAWFFDPVIQEAIYIRTSNILGKARRTRLEPDANISTIFDEELDEFTDMDEIIDKDERVQLIQYINFVEKLTKINQHYHYFVQDRFVGGRAAIHKRTNPKTIEHYQRSKVNGANRFGWKIHEDTPTNLMYLEWWRLGQIKVDRWDEVEKIEYRDSSRFAPPEEGRPEAEKGLGYMIPTDQLIYGTRIEKRYGRSIIQTILSVSEQNRLMNDQDILEITKSRWAPSGLFISKTMSDEEMANFIADRKAGIDAGVRGEMDYIKLSNDADPKPLADLRKDNVRFMLIPLDVPSFMMKQEEITNRATSAAVLGGWRALTLENDRTEFRDIIWEQFYAPLIVLWMQANGHKDFDMIDFNAKIGFVFQNLAFEDDKTQAEVVDLLQKNGVESIGESRVRMNMPRQMEEEEVDLLLQDEREAGRQEGIKEERTGLEQRQAPREEAQPKPKEKEEAADREADQ